jgi:hypothetical protein
VLHSDRAPAGILEGTIDMSIPPQIPLGCPWKDGFGCARPAQTPYRRTYVRGLIGGRIVIEMTECFGFIIRIVVDFKYNICNRQVLE